MTGLPIYLTTLVVSFGLGAPLATRLLRHRRSAWLVAPTFGYSLLAVVATLLYRLGLPMLIISALAACLAAIGVAWTAWRCRAAIRNARESILPSLLIVVGVVAWAWLPIFTGGTQFAVFQGNPWDHLNYTTAGVLYSRMDYAHIVDAAWIEFLRNPLLTIGSRYIQARPAVMLLFAALGRIAPTQEMYLSGHAFESALVVAEFMAALYVLLNLCNVTTRRDYGLAIAGAAAFAFGFWGQYILDINAWSQQAAVAPLLVAFACIVIPLRPDTLAANREGIAGSRWREASALALAGTGALYLYPEGAFFFGAMVLAFLCYVAIFARHPALRNALMPIALAAIAVLLAGVPAYNGIYAFVQGQADFATSHSVQWWKYYQAFLFGRDQRWLADVVGAPFALLDSGSSFGAALRAIFETSPGTLAQVCANLVAGVFGLYFLTPTNAANWISATILCVFILAFVVALVIGLLRMGVSSAFGNLAMFAMAGVLGALMIAGAGKFWAAGKGLSFAAPYLCLALGAGLVASMQAPKRYWYLAIALGVWTVAQLGEAAKRPIDAATATGIHRKSPYPAVFDPSFKTDFRWDISAVTKQAEACNLIRLDIPFVRLEIPSVFLRHYVALALYEQGRHYWYQEPINSYYGFGTDIGQMPLPSIAPDCVMALVDRRVQLVSSMPRVQ